MENKVFRHENKYLINRRDMDLMVRRLEMFARRDEHAIEGQYFIRSLYFDDPADSAYYEKESGLSERSKYRIRMYNMDSSRIVLEKKIKSGNYVRKESALLSMDEYRDILNGRSESLFGRSEAVANDFATAVRIRMLRPKVIVDYDRIPFVYDPGRVRITFDMNIRAVFDDLDMMRDNAPSFDVLGQDMLVMEVKFDTFIPDIFRAIMPDENCRLAVSKYVLCSDAKRRIIAV